LQKGRGKGWQPNVLVNLVSRRVRQLNSGAGATSRPLLSDTAAWGSVISPARNRGRENGWEMPELVELVRATPKKRKKH